MPPGVYNRSRLWKDVISKKELRKLYWIDELNQKQIANKFGCSESTIKNLMNKYHIKRRNISEVRGLFSRRKFKLSKEELYNLYWVDNLSLSDIATKFGVDSHTVFNLMKKYEIPRRNRTEGIRLVYKKKGLGFKKGNVPFNKGKPQEEWLSKEGIENSKKTRFKKGVAPKGSVLFKKGEKPWNIGLTKETDERLKKLGEKSSKTKKKLFAEGKLIASRKDKKHRKETLEFFSKFRKELWKDENYARKVLKKIQSKPNKPEKRLININKEYNLPLKYVGDGSFFINGLNPDFISTNGIKAVVEIFGIVYHDPNKAFMDVPWKQQEFGRTAIFSQAGYKTLILWDNEMEKMTDEEIAEKIGGFLNG